MQEFVETIAEIIDGVVVVMLVFGTLISFLRAIGATFRGLPFQGTVLRQLRVDLGMSLLVSLEVLIVSDILHSIGKRSLEELGMLAITVAIRTLLAFFLDREMADLQSENPVRAEAD